MGCSCALHRWEWRLIGRQLPFGRGGSHVPIVYFRQEEEEFFHHYKNDLERHAHTPSGDAGADLKS